MGINMIKDWVNAKEDAIEAIEGIKALVKQYHFEGRKVAPQGVLITVREMLFGWEGFENMAYTDQLVVLGEAMIFSDVLQCWIEKEHSYP
jgi:hypothetical protein